MLRTDRDILRRTLALVGGAFLLISLDVSQAEETETTPSGQESIDESDVLPIFKAACAECHSTKSRKADLDLTTGAGILAGGESGELLKPGAAAESLLFEMISEGHMPPEDRKPLSREQIALIQRWIDDGAKIARSTEHASITQHDVIPIVYRRCTMCHGGVYRLGNLDMRTPQSMRAGGDSGPALAAGRPDESRMILRVTDRECPPAADIGEAGIEPMTPDELTVVSKWIAAGAPEADVAPDVATTEGDTLVTDDDRQFWSFQPPQRPDVPRVGHDELIRNPIDAFLLEALEAKNLTFSAPSDRLTLLRRVTFDLTGLPPEPELVREFLADDRPDAYERLVDRLLTSPRYGERWGRLWLDLAGYTDSEGKRSADMVRPWAWRYRDYVIRSFNADKPYDQFLIEQIAGDELVDWTAEDAVTENVIESLVATGFLRLAPDGTTADPVNRFPDRLEVIADEIDVLSRGVLGLTMNCARCHSHKYDPIPQRDYYRLMAVFKGAYDEYEWMSPQPFGNQWNKAKHRHLTLALPEQRRAAEAFNRELDERIEALKSQQEPLDKDDPQRKDLAKQITKSQSERRELPKIRALWDRGEPSLTYVYRRGDETQPARLVGPGVPSVLTDGRTPFTIEPPPVSHSTTGRRLALARWLTQPDHPLTARVLVNRIWQHHFGTGIVQSLDNFGRLGTPPSHPELLDWLAVEFLERGWSIKQLHSLVVTSTAYRQRSAVSEEHLRRDPDNRLLSRMPLRRLDAEEVRDSLLAVAGLLSERRYGPPDQVEVRSDGLVTSKPVDGRWRRSIYVRQRRKELPTILETFDLPQMNPNCVMRSNSTVVSQPLHLLNNKRVYELAMSFAERVLSESEPYVDERIRTAWLTALGRLPDEGELEVAATALRKFKQQRKSNSGETGADAEAATRLALADFCHSLLNSAEFLFID